MKTVLLIITLFSLLNSYAQSRLVFTYDVAGNQIKRELIGRTAKSLEESIANEDVLNDSKLIEEAIKVYPNPTEGILKFKWENHEISNLIEKITVSQLSGITWEVPVQDLSNHSFTIDLTSYANGIYIVNFVLTNEELVTKKIIKNAN